MSWLVEIIEGKVHLDTGDGFSERVSAACKSIDGARWNPHRKVWTYPIHWDICKQIRAVSEKIGVELVLGPDINDWARVEKVRQAQIPSINSFEPVPLEYLPQENPWLASKLHGYQTVAVAFAARNHEVLIADHPGLGKTVEVIGGLMELGRGGPILVNAPKSAAVATWPQEVARWAPNDKYVSISSHLKADGRRRAIDEVRRYCDKYPDERYWVSMNVDYLRARGKVDQYQNYIYGPDGKKIISYGNYTIQEVFDMEWLGLVVDECQLTLAGDKGNKKKWSQQRYGLDMINVIDGGVRIAMSGTPFNGRKERAWGILNWLRPDIYTSYWKWARRYFNVEQDPWSQEEIVTSDLLPDRVESFYNDLAKVTLRRTKAEVAPHLPPKVYAGTPLDHTDPNSAVAVWLDMTPKQKKSYRLLVSKAEVATDTGTLDVNGVLAEITRQKQLANALHVITPEGELRPTEDSNKLQWIEGWLEQRNWLKNEDSTKIIIASQFTTFLDMLSAWLDKAEIPYHKLTGATSAKKRASMSHDFQESPTPRYVGDTMIFLLSTKAGGTSITLDMADDMIICDQTNDPDVDEQLEDRTHRVSRDHVVTIWHLHSKDTIEEEIATTNSERGAEIRSILDGARGVKAVRKTLEYTPSK